MIYVLIKDDVVLNCDNAEDRDRLIADGFKCLESDAIMAAGMVGYEHLVSPANTSVNVDGGITFTPPTPPSDAELLTSLRSERDARINSVLWMRERHADELTLGTEPTLTPEQYVDLLTYIQALRDLPAQPGAPWDGGGELTPWPEKPDF